MGALIPGGLDGGDSLERGSFVVALSSGCLGKTQKDFQHEKKCVTTTTIIVAVRRVHLSVNKKNDVMNRGADRPHIHLSDIDGHFAIYASHR